MTRPNNQPLRCLTPVARGASLPNLKAAVVIASCDGDVGLQDRRYLRRARHQGTRSEPVFLAELDSANHNYFNRTLSRLRRDDAMRLGRACRPPRRLRPLQQQSWLDRAAADFFATSLLDAPRPSWLRLRGRLPSRAYGRRVTVERYAPRWGPPK